MIFEAVIRFFTAFVNFFIDLLPTSQPPGWLTNASGYLDVVWGYGAGLGAWIPWSLVGTVVTGVLACVAIGFTIKVARIVASFFTAGGGSAA